MRHVTIHPRLHVATWVIASVFVLGLPPLAQAAEEIGIGANRETSVVVNWELGSVLRFPVPVKMVTASQHFVITDAAGAGQGMGVMDGSASGTGPVDVRMLLVKAEGAPGGGGQKEISAGSESVSVVLAGGKSVTLRLTASSGAEKFYDLKWDTPPRRGKGGRFLSHEMAMMRAMLVDEAGAYAREVPHEKVMSELNDLTFELLRIYGGPDLVGYVFLVSNYTSNPVRINSSGLEMGKPNRAVLVQGDDQELKPCPMISSPDKNCQAALRVVVRGKKTDPLPLLSQAKNPARPFVKTEVKN